MSLNKLPLKVGIIGVGLVGKELIKELSKLSDYQLVGVMNSKKQLILSEGITDFNQDSIFNHARSTPNDIYLFLDELSAIEGEKVLIDCTSDESIAQLYPMFLESGFHVVTPNKKAFSGDLSLFKSIEASSSLFTKKVYHESTVGAGLPVIETLSNMVRSGDKIVKIEGVFSGTLSYLFNNFSNIDTEGSAIKGFSEWVKTAKDLGYTEPDPRDDLNGLDVARKVVILGRIAGLDIDLSTLEVENIVPEELRQLNTSSEFMEQLPKFDSHFDTLNKQALEEGTVLRYVGLVDPNGQSSVRLMKYDAKHPFASLTGSNNIIAFTTERFPSPLIIQGAGAGALVTVHGILTDLLKIRDSLSY